jgi:hypothetical protein
VRAFLSSRSPAETSERPHTILYQSLPTNARKQPGLERVGRREKTDGRYQAGEHYHRHEPNPAPAGHPKQREHREDKEQLDEQHGRRGGRGAGKAGAAGVLQDVVLNEHSGRNGDRHLADDEGKGEAAPARADAEPPEQQPELEPLDDEIDQRERKGRNDRAKRDPGNAVEHLQQIGDPEGESKQRRAQDDLGLQEGLPLVAGHDIQCSVLPATSGHRDARDRSSLLTYLSALGG